MLENIHKSCEAFPNFGKYSAAYIHLKCDIKLKTIFLVNSVY